MSCTKIVFDLTRFALVIGLLCWIPSQLDAQFNRPGGSSSFPSSPSSRSFPQSQNFPRTRNLPNQNMRSRSNFGTQPTFRNPSRSTLPNNGASFPNRPTFPSSSTNSLPSSSSGYGYDPMRSSRIPQQESKQSTSRPRYGRLIGLGIKIIIGLFLLAGGGAGYFAVSRGGDGNDDLLHGQASGHQNSGHQSSGHQANEFYNPYSDANSYSNGKGNGNPYSDRR